MSGNNGGGGGGHRSNKNRSGSGSQQQQQQRGGGGRGGSQQQSLGGGTTTRSSSPTTTLSNASSSKKSNPSLGHHHNNSNTTNSKYQKQQQQQQQQQNHNNHNQNPPLPPTVTVNSKTAERYNNNNNATTNATSNETMPAFQQQQQQQHTQPAKKKMDILKVLAEVEAGSFQVTCRECFWISVALAFLALCSIVVGIAAGMTISIHYYGEEIRVLPKQKATLLDPAIALTNVVLKPTTTTTSSTTQTSVNGNTLTNTQLQPLDLGRVITTSKTGQRDMLTVVEELPPLPREDDNKDESKFDTTSHPQQQPSLPPIRSILNFTSPVILPKLCEGGSSSNNRNYGRDDDDDGDPTIPIYGFDDWYTLRKAIQEANALSAERFMKWNEYMANYPAPQHQLHHHQQKRQQPRQDQQPPHTDVNSPFAWDNLEDNDRERADYEDDGNGEDDDDFLFWYYQDEVVFTICPNAILTARGSSMPIFINAENLRLECDNCIISKPGTHFNFGRHAQDVWIRGITFTESLKRRSISTTKAPPPSVTFYQDGARANFQDCVWLNYHNYHPSSTIDRNNNNHNTNTNKNDNHPSNGRSYYSWFTHNSAPTSQSSQSHQQQLLLVPERPSWETVADVNSSSVVNFYRCRIGKDTRMSRGS